MAQGISSVNGYVGDLKTSEKVVKAFGTSLMASGKSADDIQEVAVNLGQLNTKSFTKMDWNQLIKGVPAVSARLS